MIKTPGTAHRIKCGGWLLLAVLIAALAGCQAALFSYKGAMVRNAFLIPLKDGSQKSAAFESPDLIIEYDWERNGNELDLFGDAKFTPKIRNGYTLVHGFWLGLLLTDAQGKVLEQRWIETPGSEDPQSRMHIREKLLLPPSTAQMAFIYSGEARESSDTGIDNMPFWHVPLLK